MAIDIWLVCTFFMNYLNTEIDIRPINKIILFYLTLFYFVFIYVCCFFYPHVCSFQCWNAVGGFREWLVGIIDCRKMWMSFLFLGFCWCSFFVCLLLRAREWKQRNSQGDYTMKWTHTVVTNKCRGCFRVWFHSVRFMSLLFSHFFSLSRF